MAVKAIDVALIPSKEVIDYCIKVSKKAKELDKAFFELGKEDFVPHVTLVLGCVEEENLPLISSKLNEILGELREISLEIKGFGMYPQPDGNNSLYLDVKISDQLRKLHERAIGVVKQYLVECKDALVLVEGEKTGISEGSMKILNKFTENYSNENYHAHISLGVFDFEGKEHVAKVPLSFKVSKIAFFQVGNKGTCRREISSVSLN